MLGYNQGSKTPAEWDITDYVQAGENTVALEVYRWSAGPIWSVRICGG